MTVLVCFMLFECASYKHKWDMYRNALPLQYIKVCVRRSHPYLWIVCVQFLFYRFKIIVKEGHNVGRKSGQKWIMIRYFKIPFSKLYSSLCFNNSVREYHVLILTVRYQCKLKHVNLYDWNICLQRTTNILLSHSWRHIMYNYWTLSLTLNYIWSYFDNIT